MSATANGAAWPDDDDAVAVAFAAKVVLLAAASRTCAIEPSEKAQRELLGEIARAAGQRHVNGQPFSRFLASAKERIKNNAADQHLNTGPAAATLVDLEKAKPVDIIGTVYDRLLRLAASAYEGTLGERFAPRLERCVIESSTGDRPLPFEGTVPLSLTSVMLTVYAEEFDLRSLALIPYVLAHELVCHVGARAVRSSRAASDAAIRMFFADGFMDRVAWVMLLLWLGSDELPTDIPVGHLTEGDVKYASRRPHAFQAGRAAWSNCTAALDSRMQARSGAGTVSLLDLAQSRAAAAATAIEAALKANACKCSGLDKDVFVDQARNNDESITGMFADLALSRAAPIDLFERAAQLRADLLNKPRT